MSAIDRVRRIRTVQNQPQDQKPSREEILARLAKKAAEDRGESVEDSTDLAPVEGESEMEAGDRIEQRYRARADSPLRAIRAFCVLCVGCQPRMVEKCTAKNCVLYPFRMGNNPYQKRT